MTNIDSFNDLGSTPAQIMHVVGRHRRDRTHLHGEREKFDSSSPAEHQIRTALHALAALERANFSKQVRDEIASARAMGKRGSRPKVMTPERQAIAAQMIGSGLKWHSILPMLQALQGPPIGKSSYFKWQKAWRDAKGSVAR